jgi:hypothetical protein
MRPMPKILRPIPIFRRKPSNNALQNIGKTIDLLT